MQRHRLRPTQNEIVAADARYADIRAFGKRDDHKLANTPEPQPAQIHGSDASALVPEMPKMAVGEVSTVRNRGGG